VEVSSGLPYIIAYNALDFVVLDEMAGTVQHQAQLATDFVLLENLLTGHEIDHLEFHQEGVEKLGVAAVKDLTAGCALLDDSSVLAV
jgi:hypothetical protein